MNKEEISKIFIQSGALLKGHFVLTSGRHSDQYMQCAQVLQYPGYTDQLTRVIAEGFAEDKIDVVVAPAMGGIIVGYEVARHLGTKSIFCEREAGKMSMRRGFVIEPGQRVLVVEDVVTTGGSVKEVIELVRSMQGTVVGVGILVDRSGGKTDFGVKTVSVLSMEIESFPAEDCPLCKAGGAPAVKPGSRSLS